MKTEVILSALEAKHPGEKEYLQAVKEVLLSIEEVYNQHPEFEKAKIIERLVEPERIFTFRVPWVDDKGEIQVNWKLSTPENPPVSCWIKKLYFLSVKPRLHYPIKSQ